MRNDKTLFQKQAVYHKNRFSELKQCLFSPCNSENILDKTQVIYPWKEEYHGGACFLRTSPPTNLCMAEILHSNSYFHLNSILI